MAGIYSSASEGDSNSSQSSVDLDLLGFRHGQLSPPTETATPEVIAISSDDEDLLPSAAPSASTSAANSQPMPLVLFGRGVSPVSSSFGPSNRVSPDLNVVSDGLTASGDEIGDEIYRSTLHIVLNQVMNSPSGESTGDPGPPNNRPFQANPGQPSRSAEMSSQPRKRMHRAQTSRAADHRVSRPRPIVVRISQAGHRPNLEHLMSSSSSDQSDSRSESTQDSASGGDETTESDTEVDEQNEMSWCPRPLTAVAANGNFASAASSSGTAAVSIGDGPVMGQKSTHSMVDTSRLESIRLPSQDSRPRVEAGLRREQPSSCRQTDKRLLDPIARRNDHDYQRALTEAQQERERQQRLAMQVQIELRVPRLPQWDDIEVTTLDGTKMKAKFPEVMRIENASKSPPKPPKPLSKLIQGHDPNILQQAVKSFEDLMDVSESLKKFQLSSVIHAKWIPQRHKAEVTLRKGKMLETMGSAGNPTMLEFYEAMYLLERAKLRLTCPDGVPMSVFDAYATLFRDEADHELFLVFEHLIEGGCIVTPYRKPAKRSTKPRTTGHTEESKLLLAAQALSVPNASTSQSAFARDSDSDLEIISCNMPLPPDKNKTPKEIELVYSTGTVYEGKPVEFLNISCAGQCVIMDSLPSELLPACAAIDTNAATELPKISVPGRSLTILENWITPPEKEKFDPIDEETGDFREPGRGGGRQKKRKGDVLSPKKSPAPKRGKKAKQAAPTEVPLDCFAERLDHAARSLVLGLPPCGDFPVPNDAATERFHRRWFPRWFDGLELGVISSSVQSTLHKFTRDGFPAIPSARNWDEYKQEFARMVAERHTFSNGDNKRSALYRGTTKPLMTGTKGNMTSLIFEELTLGKEVTEDLPTLLERFEKMKGGSTATDALTNGQLNGVPVTAIKSEVVDDSPDGSTPNENSTKENHLEVKVEGGPGVSTNSEKDSQQTKAETPPPQIVFDVFTDSEFSKTSSSLPDFRVVLLREGSQGVLKFRDLVRLSVEAQDTTLLVAHVVDGRVRTRQVMPFSIPRYN